MYYESIIFLKHSGDNGKIEQIRLKRREEQMVDNSDTTIKHDLGLNVLQRMFAKAFDHFQCDEFECISYNVNLDIIIRLFEKYPELLKVRLWSNTEKVSYSPKNKATVLELIEKEKIIFFHVSENEIIIHSKMYNFKKNGQTQFAAIGSPNLSEGANQNFESLIYIFEQKICDQIWESIPKKYSVLNVNTQENPPSQFYHTKTSEIKLDAKIVNGLWAHQKAILEWQVNRQLSIVNIPPGTGKTEIAFAYLRNLFANDKNFTVIVLVPTTTLIKQWSDRLKKNDISCSEWGNNLTNLGNYLANPHQKVLVTLYERFFNQYLEYIKNAKIIKPNIVLILDECHNCYGHIEDLRKFRHLIETYGISFCAVGLSATIDSFKILEVNNFIDFMGGNQNRFNISLQSFYSHWNTLNPTKVLKKIKYTPIKYCLNASEMDKLSKFGRKIAIEMGRSTLGNNNESTAAIQRARWLRGLKGGVDALKNYISLNIDGFTDKATVIFVQTNEIASDLQSFITSQPGWNPESSIYVYDSTRDQEFLSYAMKQFSKRLGFCLISEKMLSEGFDLPKIGKVILHGSDKSPRDWIQKIGRAMRYDSKDPESIAEIVDVVFCEPNGNPLTLENERYEVLKSISM